MIFRSGILRAINLGGILVKQLDSIKKKFAEESEAILTNLSCYMAAFEREIEANIQCSETRIDVDELYTHIKKLNLDLDNTSEANEYANQEAFANIRILSNKITKDYENDDIEDEDFIWLNFFEIERFCSALDSTYRFNIFRQAFLLIVTLFDYVISDIFKCFVKERFFECLSRMSIDKSYKLKEIVSSNTFDDFKEVVYDDLIKSLKITDILEMLYNHYLNKSSYNYAIEDIFEIIERRNIHIHKMGIVDQKYNDISKHKHKYKNGDYAVIGCIYFTSTYKTLIGFIENIT